jgi:hypothetical protein
MKRRKIVAIGTFNAALVAMVLVRRSRSFVMEPLPDDEYEFDIKEEDIPRLMAVLDFLVGGKGLRVNKPYTPGRTNARL